MGLDLEVNFNEAPDGKKESTPLKAIYPENVFAARQTSRHNQQDGEQFPSSGVPLVIPRGQIIKWHKCINSLCSVGAEATWKRSPGKLLATTRRKS